MESVGKFATKTLSLRIANEDGVPKPHGETSDPPVVCTRSGQMYCHTSLLKSKYINLGKWYQQSIVGFDIWQVKVKVMSL